MRELDPVHRSELLCGWVVTRFDDVSALLRDPTISSSIHNATPTPLTVHEIERLSEQPRAARTIVMADDPDHARIRRLMADPFRPRQVEVLRQRITERVAAALDLMAQLVTLYMAGHEPTAALIGAGTLALLGAPDQLARVRVERGLRRGAASELLRYDGPNQFVRRITTRPTRIGEVELPPGAVVYASPASANRDHRRWGPDADRVVVDRPDAGSHLQFGAGAHACLGSHLARLQAEVAFDAVFDRLDDLELAGPPEWSTRMFIRGLSSLPVRCCIRP